MSVYYKRNVYNVQFYNSRGTSEYTQYKITAKYEANIREKWPTHDGSSSWYVATNSNTSQVGIDTMPLNGAKFYGPQTGYGTSTAYYYVEVLPGESGDTTVSGVAYKLHHKDTSPGTSYRVTKEDQYPITGFTFNSSPSTSIGGRYNNAKFYYTRNSYNIVYVSGGQTVNTASKKFEESIADAGSYTPTVKPAGMEDYDFGGWHADPAGEQAYTFTGKTMPAQNVTVYAKWNKPVYNGTIYLTIEGTTGSSITLNVPKGDTIETALNEKQAEIMAQAGEGYTWRGWRTGKDGTGEPFNPKTQITTDVTLYPYYTKDGTFKVEYDAVKKDVTAPVDGKSYAEDSFADLMSPGKLVADGEYFLGWSDGAATYQPRDKYQIKTNHANKENIITLTAQWGARPAGTTLTVPEGKTFTNDGTVNVADENAVVNNNKIVCRSHSGGTATCDTKALCEDCGASYGEVKHSATVNYQYAGGDSNQHKILCSACGKVIGTESCTFTEANCQAASSCIKCHHTVGEKNPSKHIGGTKAVHNEGTETHNVICVGCNTVLEKDVPCTSDNSANCKHKSKCTECGGEVGALGDHKEGTPATCTTKAVCSVCGQAYGEPLGHDLVNGVCTRIATGKCVCQTDHKGLWKNADASQNTVKCTECGATIEKEALAVSFTLTGYGVGKASKNVRVTSGSDKVTVRSITISPEDATFKAGTRYSFAIAYTVENGYRVDSATVNGTRAELADTFVSVSLFSPDSYYSISYDLAGGKLPAGKTNPTTYTKESGGFTLVNPTRTGYDFAGWKGTGLDQATMTVTVPAGSTGNRSYTATWTAKSYTVTFDVQGHGTAPKAQTVDYGKKAATPKAPTESGYAFGGWYQDTACAIPWDFDTDKVKKNMTLYAKWL